jgi:hypothetical protein
MIAPTMQPRPWYWEARLNEHLERHARTPFAWGSHDCITFAAGAVVAAGGPDLMSCIVRPWNRRRAMLFVEMLGGVGGCITALARVAGMLPIATGYAMRGHLVLVDNNGQPAAGVVVGATVAIVSDPGFALRPFKTITHAWAW